MTGPHIDRAPVAQEPADPATEDRLGTAHGTFVRGDLALAEELALAALAEGRAKQDRAAIGAARLLLGEIAHDSLRYGPAKEHIELAARDLEAALGRDHERTRNARASLAVVLHDLHDDEAAGRELEAAVSGLDATPPSEMSPDLAELFLTVGVAHAALGRIELSRVTLGGLVDALERAGAADTDPARLATALLQLASVVAQDGETGASLSHLERCLELRRRAFGGGNARVAAAAFAVARSHAAAGRVDAARPLAVDAMTAMEAAGRADEPRMSTAHATLGLVLLLGGDTAGATKRFERACSIEEKTFGAAHPGTATMMLMLAQLHAGLRNWGKVAGICKRIIPVLSQRSREAHALATASELEVMALCALGRTKDARASAASALEVLRRHGASGAELATAHASLGRAELASGRGERAIESLEHAVARAREADDPELVSRLEQEVALIRSGARPTRHRS